MKHLTLALALLMGACSPQAAKAPVAPAAAAAAPPAAAPGTSIPEATVMSFVGNLPCADCPGIRTELTLTRDAPYSGDGHYKLVETYIDRGAPFTSTGVWGTLRGDATDEDATVYELNPEKSEAARRHFKRIGDEALQALGKDLRPWPSGLPDMLKRVK
jgi:uncharacterized lipoprotein NlpE involved in copper resistance